MCGGLHKAMHAINIALGINTNKLPFNMGTTSPKKKIMTPYRRASAVRTV